MDFGENDDRSFDIVLSFCGFCEICVDFLALPCSLKDIAKIEVELGSQ